ncbi:MAG: pur operon repressor [Vallitaleaceae bacterium]|nr:pur operon repressor [Vallitaleaceae bacterium]
MKLTKAQRLSMLTKILVDHPFTIYTLQHFTEIFDCAKSTLSEDIASIEEALKEMEEGEIISVAGAAGGLYYAPYYTQRQIQEVKFDICRRLNDYSRVIPGGFVYMNDLFFDPRLLKKMSHCIVTHYRDCQIDYVVTIETKGIPLAMSIANDLSIPVAVVRKSAKLSEGTTLQLNYLTGSSKTIKNMSMPIRSLKRGSSVLIVDDFMKAGGTAKGIVDLLNEFECKIVGIAVVLSAEEPNKKLIDEYFTLVRFDGIDEEKQQIMIRPS